jgi:hypothetical protein
MSDLLTAARQALPGAKWEEMGDGQVAAKLYDRWGGMRPTPDGRVAAWFGDAYKRHNTPKSAAQWLRSQILSRRDALDAALGESDRGTERQAAIAIAAACLDTGLVPQGVSGTVEAVRAVCDRAVAAEAKLKVLAGLVQEWKVIYHADGCVGKYIPACSCGLGVTEAIARAKARRVCGVDNG